mmetsp:Transcript_4121/g.8914  ORF Transcript_4121/g.8914 Transcript_4121/m.8914 type:complete len:365 (+) Transcript_4121:233-1327(+)
MQNHVVLTKHGLGVTKIQNLGDLFDLLKSHLQILLSVSSRNAETDTTTINGYSGSTNDNNSEVAVVGFPREGSNLCGVEEHHRDDRRIIITENRAAHFFQRVTEEVGVFSNGAQAITAHGGAIFTSDNPKGSQDLLRHDRREASRIYSTSRCGTNVVNQVLGCSNVATHTTKTLCKGAHEDVNFIRVHACMLTNTTAGLSKSTNGVRFVNISVALVFFGNVYNATKVTELSFHTVNTFHNNHNHCPWAVHLARFTSAFNDRRTNYSLKIHNIVVLERRGFGAGVTATVDDGGMVKFVADNERARACNSRECQGIRVESHVEYKSSRLANKTSYLLLEFSMNSHGASISHRRARSWSVEIKRSMN